MMSEAGSHDDGGSSMIFGNERHKYSKRDLVN